MLETLLSNRTVSVLWEALPRILSAGLTMTIPLTLVSFTLAMVLAVAPGGRGRRGGTDAAPLYCAGKGKPGFQVPPLRFPEFAGRPRWGGLFSLG